MVYVGTALTVLDGVVCLYGLPPSPTPTLTVTWPFVLAAAPTHNASQTSPPRLPANPLPSTPGGVEPQKPMCEAPERSWDRLGGFTFHYVLEVPSCLGRQQGFEIRTAYVGLMTCTGRESVTRACNSLRRIPQALTDANV